MRLLLRLIPGLLLGLGLLVNGMRGLEPGFLATLSAEQQTASGLTGLTANERACLDRLVAAEFAPGREIYSAIKASFSQRQTAEDRQQAGLERLNREQLDLIDAYVAAALGPRPQPKERPRIKDSEILRAKPPPEIHGAITLGLGWGDGGTARYGALQLEYYDPAHGFSLGLGLESYSGPGHLGYYPYGAYSGLPGASATYFPDFGHPVWAQGRYGGRAGFITPPIQQPNFAPGLAPAPK